MGWTLRLRFPLAHFAQRLFPVLFGAVVEAGSDLGDDFHGEEIGGSGCFRGGDTVRDAVEK